MVRLSSVLQLVVDPFNTLFQLLILDAQDSFYNFSTPHVEELLNDESRNVYFCIDEAQCDLDESVTDGVEIPSSVALRHKCSIPRCSHFPLARHWEPVNFFITGTSLRMGDTISIIERVKYTFSFDRIVPKVKKHVDCPLSHDPRGLQEVVGATWNLR
ncbi:hypothetical protein GJ744_005658 [Endocarpon pusillum]|uniref:Uncharacterized protein n=1 Tax=Endocarpon pusillum TaxID=364733 RepID=A0A8H7A8J8_9EURO|nr:hypothetical protein GJ744_005658 [Endocarpon pusillum]